MGNKVFLSFLGTNNYIETYYQLKYTISNNSVRFIQESLIDIVCKDWSDKDEIIIFCTEDSYKKNWLDNGHSNSNNTLTEIETKGLENILKSKSLIPKFRWKKIKEGFTEQEIWEIFDDIYHEIPKKSKIYLDVTHAFRSIPIFTNVLLNYTKFLKRIEIESIFYGAFEKLGPVYLVKNLPVEQRIAPILDLTSIIKFQEITQATSEFLNFGKMGGLGISLDEINNPNSKKERKLNENIKVLKKALDNLDNYITSCRINSIYEGKEIEKFFDAYDILIKEDLLLPAQKLVFDKLHNRMKSFRPEKSHLNVIAAAIMAHENKMLQQAYTLGFEIIITLFTEKIIEHKQNFNFVETNKNIDVCFREFASSLLGISEKDIKTKQYKNHLLLNEQITRILLDTEWVKELRENFDLLQNNRNTINHGKGTISFHDLDKQFISSFKNSLLILKIEIPC